MLNVKTVKLTTHRVIRGTDTASVLKQNEKADESPAGTALKTLFKIFAYNAKVRKPYHLHKFIENVLLKF